MLKITLKLYPAEWRAMVNLFPRYSELVGIDIKNLAIENLVLAEFCSRITHAQLLQWQQRRDNHLFSYSLPLSVAHTLWSEMQHCQLNSVEQLLLHKLDKAITDFKPFLL